MRRIRVDIPGRGYDICIGEDILYKSGPLIREIYGGKKAAIVTDGNVYPLYYWQMARSLQANGIEPCVTFIEPGEASKSQACLMSLYDMLLSMDMTRSGLIIALGGGVVGNLAGFAAATLMGGIPLVQIPTSLLAQADSCVGGKVAVNHEKGKNLIGTFYQPKLVISDTECLKTLDKRSFACGMAEIIKHAATADAELFGELEAKRYDLPETVARSCEIKRRVVELDEFDTGIRRIMDFGHTFAHAIENVCDFGVYTHGEAVSLGMVLECGLGEKLRVTKPGTAQRLAEVLSSFGLPVSLETDVKSLFKAMLFDEKRDGGMIDIALLTDIGDCKVHSIDMRELEDML